MSVLVHVRFFPRWRDNDFEEFGCWTFDYGGDIVDGILIGNGAGRSQHVVVLIREDLDN